VNELADILRRRIEAEGPLSIAQYMQEALGNPDHGYYRHRDPLGRGGDFITAPEISQMFGELIGLWCVAQWQGLGSPGTFNLVELGPGRGTLMADALRAAAQVHEFTAAARLHLVETSPTLRQLQSETLGAFQPTWHEDIGALPGGPAVFVANEFFDALPIRQFEKTAGAWHERMVSVADGGLGYVLASDPVGEPPIPDSVLDSPDGSIAEVSPAGREIMTGLASRLAEHAGAALIVDYGHVESAAGDTLQAVRGHKYHDVLADAGEADITAHVDFESLGRTAREAGAAVHGPVSQGAFLDALGVAARAEALIAGAPGGDAEQVRSAHARLTGADDMGELFKVMAVTGPGMAVPPGFFHLQTA